VDDIARAASVAKGTIYLHWKNRDQLFVALLRRERVNLLTEVRASMSAQAHSATLRALLARLALVYQRRPLLTALLVRDIAVIGKLARQGPVPAGMRGEFADYLRTLRDERLIRTDQTLTQQVNLVGANFFGFLAAPGILPAGYELSDEDTAELLAETVCRTIQHGVESISDSGSRLAEATMRFLDGAVADAEAKYRLVATGGTNGQGDHNER
jgi:AcrR family transcriptional regulator